MKKCLLAALSLGISVPAALTAADPDVVYPMRAGLFDQWGGVEFTRSDTHQGSYAERLTDSGWLSGYSNRYNGGSTQLGLAFWVTNTGTGSTERIGLFSGAEFTR